MKQIKRNEFYAQSSTLYMEVLSDVEAQPQFHQTYTEKQIHEYWKIDVHVAIDDER